MARQARYEPERLKMLADAVFAIAMTLLVLDLKVPELSPADVDPGLGEQLRANLSGYAAYALSFYVLGLIWLGHVRLFRRVAAADDWLLRANLFLLCFVGVLPFPTALLGRYASHTWGILPYAGCMIALELLLAAMWWWCARHDLFATRDDGVDVRAVLSRYLAIAGVFALSVPVAVVAPHRAAWVWLLLAVVQPIATRLGGRPPVAQQNGGAGSR